MRMWDMLAGALMAMAVTTSPAQALPAETPAAQAPVTQAPVTQAPVNQVPASKASAPPGAPAGTAAMIAELDALGRTAVLNLFPNPHRERRRAYLRSVAADRPPPGAARVTAAPASPPPPSAGTPPSPSTTRGRVSAAHPDTVPVKPTPPQPVPASPASPAPAAPAAQAAAVAAPPVVALPPKVPLARSAPVPSVKPVQAKPQPVKAEPPVMAAPVVVASGGEAAGVATMPTASAPLAKAEASKVEPPKAEAPKAEVPKGAASKPDTPTGETIRVGPAVAERVGSTPPKADTAKPEVAKAEAPKVETAGTRAIPAPAPQPVVTTPAPVPVPVPAAVPAPAPVAVAEPPATSGGSSSAVSIPANWRDAARPGHRYTIDGIVDLYQRLNANPARKKFFDIPPGNFTDTTALSGKKIAPQQLVGDWYCRTIKVVKDAAFGFPYFNCRISKKDGRLFFEKTSGTQRRAGWLFEDDGKRLVFLGAMAYGEDTPGPYSGLRGAVGGDPALDVVGMVVAGNSGQFLAVFPEADAYELYELVK